MYKLNSKMYKKIHNNLDIEEQTKECLKKVAIKITDFPSINRVLFAIQKVYLPIAN